MSAVRVTALSFGKFYYYRSNDMPKCTKCKKVLGTSEFHKCKQNKKGLSYQCKACRTIRAKEWYKEKLGDGGMSYSDRNRKSKYGVTPEKFKAMRNECGDACSICGRPETKVVKGVLYDLTIDHCHTTGKIRGLLCASCNLAIGMLQDDIDILASAISYLKNSVI